MGKKPAAKVMSLAEFRGDQDKPSMPTQSEGKEVGRFKGGKGGDRGGHEYGSRGEDEHWRQGGKG
eukprot:CAMPEP_0179335034 /NCGR_PEP_ID=MMETSP0797-20121207/66269_1 /TAXON_ID=47934 /ORGANISM="Dinophysis acuminata, Strain DAEP01" /LENGTH=64 /DNA_ID=CAMNT_0021048377 /DNA_START=73 /DNA_END=264 /DNA_ORIENTATION=+